MFYTGLSVESFDDILYLVGGAASTSTYSAAVGPDLPKKRIRNQSLSPDAELLLTLMKLRHNFHELDLAQRFSVSQSTVSRMFLDMGTLSIPYFQGDQHLAISSIHRQIYAQRVQRKVSIYQGYH